MSEQDDPYAALRKELRGPVASIQSYVRTLMTRGETLSQSARSTIYQVILQQSKRVDGFLDDVLLYVRVLSGDVEITTEPLLVAVIAEEVRQRLGEPERVAIEVGTDVVVQADHAAMSETLRRLVRNALVYGPREGTVRISGTSDGSWVEIGVHDTGLGIPAEAIDAALKPFIRSVQPGERRSDGAGLGLTVAAELARLMGGELTLRDSDPGLTAALRLPA